MFEIEFGCRNCGREWAEQFAPGDEIKNSWDGSWLQSHACTHKIPCSACRQIKCVNCNSRKVSVKSRKPVGLADGAQANGAQAGGR